MFLGNISGATRITPWWHSHGALVNKDEDSASVYYVGGKKVIILGVLFGTKALRFGPTIVGIVHYNAVWA